ncbi:hypothetical protein K504DRAFT_532680 [Pleomassaria siparia CBS 279.74]|uniref:Uncharacterized protein n=1 Tax=Pleomassaria siparia CBS 279.74 TaxID=1314801 RepID=A0A6G1KDU7_9PLEO|nr:hypothetical protein K504DRAFT_532680 [Pleomassaria siparia CBS 279.74]
MANATTLYVPDEDYNSSDIQVGVEEEFSDSGPKRQNLHTTSDTTRRRKAIRANWIMPKCWRQRQSHFITDEYYFHWGPEGKYGSYDDAGGKWESECELSTTLDNYFDTPLGNALWTPGSPDCLVDTTEGKWYGQLLGPDMDFAYDCYQLGPQSFTNNCGLTFASNTKMYCKWTWSPGGLGKKLV